MELSHLMIAGLNFTRTDGFTSGVQKFIADRSLLLSLTDNFCNEGCMKWWTDFTAWIAQPHILAIITAWWITFTVFTTLVMCLGFGPAGVVAGSIAAGFQSVMYGAFTPAAGIFATLTSMAMLGTLIWPVVIVASLVATGVAALVWRAGLGR